MSHALQCKILFVAIALTALFTAVMIANAQVRLADRDLTPRDLLAGAGRCSAPHSSPHCPAPL